MPHFPSTSPLRCADAGRCNKCFAPLDPDGICRHPHASMDLPTMVEQGPWIGKSHIGNLAKAVGE